MTANQRRPGFRLPWSSEEDGTMTEGDPSTSAETAMPSEAAQEQAVAATDAPPAAEAPAAVPAVEVAKPSAPAPAPAPASAPAPAPAPAAAAAPESTSEGGDEFMRDLVAAMRAVADEARQVGVTELKTKADEQVQTLEAEADRRRQDLRKAADADIAGVGEWAASEADRIEREAEQKVISRKARLDQEMAADAGRTEAESKAVRDRVADYERELEAYHAQLSEINDPAAFAAAAKRLPKPPALGGSAAAAPTAAASAPTAPEPSAAIQAVVADAASNGVAADAEATNAEVLATRLAELDATLPDAPAAAAEPTDEPEAVEAVPATDAAAPTDATVPTEPAVPAEAPPAPAAPVGEMSVPVANGTPTLSASVEPAVTEVVVKGLGSFGAITGFRQSLSGVDGIESVALSLGQTGEFVFRATHTPGFDLKAAITALEGDGAKIEARPEGGWRVTLERAR